MSSILLQNGRLIDPSSGMDEVRDVWIVDGKIRFKKPEKDTSTKTINVTGQIVCPGLIDLGLHLNNQKDESPKNAIEDLSRKLASAGFAKALISLKTGGDSPLMLNAIHSVCDSCESKTSNGKGAILWPAAWISNDAKGESMANLALLAQSGAAAFWEDGFSIQSDLIWAQAIEYAGKHGLTFFENCHHAGIANGGCMHEGAVSTSLGLSGISPLAEELMVARAILYAEHFKVKIHCNSISTAQSVRMLREAKSRGVPISASASAHHLWFTENDLQAYDTRLKTLPPIRTKSDQEALISAVLDGTIDTLTSSHSTETFDRKEIEFEKASFGISSLSTALSCYITRLIHEHQIKWPSLIDRLACAPARILGKEIGSLREDSPATITVIDPSLKWQVDVSTLPIPEPYNPWHGATLQGRATLTFVDGELVWNLKQPSKN